ncbi:MAG: adenine deaminase [Firmicutes bacterium]|nr:adenine deaminase [Bacillota bacterium]
MFPQYKETKLFEVSQHLVDVAMGRLPADLVIRNASLVNVHTAEIIPNTDVAVACGRIALVGKAEHTIGENTVVIDAEGSYLAPGFLDAHIHVESSMVTVTGFAQAVVPYGTTGIFMDPHEIANVLGVEGIRLMHEEGRKVPLRVFTTVPSCVPAAPGMEDAGAKLGPEDIKEVLTWDGVVGLGEMMNYPGVLANDKNVQAIIKETLAANKVVTGHFAMSATDHHLQAYLAAGITSCHESVTKEDTLAKLRSGMYAMLREGSAWHDIKETIRAITEEKIDTSFCLLCSDDTHPETILSRGHLNHVVRRAIEEGLNPIRAIQMVTINTARYFRCDADLGSIAPGKYADLLLISDLTRVVVDKVIIAGAVVAEKGKMLTSASVPQYPDFARQSLRLAKPLQAEDFHITASENNGTVKVRVMQIEEAQVTTQEQIRTVPIKDGLIYADPSTDLAKAAVFDRHHENGTYALGFVTGFGFTHGAVASTVAHDSHNLLIVGTNDADMALAGNTLVEQGGGMVAVADGKVLALVPLPVAGLMSDRPVEVVATAVAKLAEAWKELGCSLLSPFMTMAMLSLPVIPSIRLTNRGLVDVNTFSITNLIVEE